MSQADSINTTSRRGFLTKGAATVAGGAAILSTPAFAAPTKTLDATEASPALRDAVVALRESHDRLEAAEARFAADDLKMVEWRENNPQPTNRRARKRHTRKWREYQDATVGESWAALLEAEKDFQNCQMAVAKVTPRDENDLMLKAAVGAVYDKVKMASGFDVALISYSVTWDLFKMRRPA